MLAKVYSYGICGLDPYRVTIEVDVSRGLPSVIIVGLPDNAIKESKERVRSAIKNSGYTFPSQRITINLSPADIKKEGPNFDLAMSIGILMASGQMEASHLNKYILLGELSLDGSIQPITGVLSIALSVNPQECPGIVLPALNAKEASLTEKIKIFPVKKLSEVVHFFKNHDSINPLPLDKKSLFEHTTSYESDFNDVKGQLLVKRGLEIAAAGAHNVLLIGPPGSGKTMLAKRMSSILPDMTIEEALEVTKIYSIMGLIPRDKGIMITRPFRSPHHTTSDVALIGGGSMPRPGEVTLSHNGILFLDELPEFNRNVLEALRQPLEDNYVTVARAAKSIRFPSKFMLVSSMNPCPCGWYTDPKKECHCSVTQVQKYLSKISGPLMDRIDIHLEVPSLNSTELLSNTTSETSQEIKSRTTHARKIQLERFSPAKSGANSEGSLPVQQAGASNGNNASLFANAQMSHRQIKQHCLLDEDTKNFLKTAIESLRLSARAHDKVLKVARTIADLEKEETILKHHIAEAVQYRSLDRNWWAA